MVLASTLTPLLTSYGFSVLLTVIWSCTTLEVGLGTGATVHNKLIPSHPDTEPEDLELEEEMEISDNGGNNASASGPGKVEDIIMNCGVENSDNEQGLGSDSSELDSQDDSDEDSDKSSGEDSDDNGYGSF